MVSQKNGQTNGTVKPVQDGKPAAENAATLHVVKDEKKREAPDLPPVEDRILKVSQLFSLVEKHETLKETEKKLKAFKLSSDGSADTLRLTDSKGNVFSTSNSACIAGVLDTLKGFLAAQILEVENKIRL